MRLIDADALKEEINKKKVVGRFNTLLLIDNAPTVEPFEPDYVGAERLKARQRGYEEGYRNGMEIGKTLNPKIKQGEWIDHSEDYGYAECPICKHLTNCEGDVDELHYCWYCGARLVRGGADLRGNNNETN